MSRHLFFLVAMSLAAAACQPPPPPEPERRTAEARTGAVAPDADPTHVASAKEAETGERCLRLTDVREAQPKSASRIDFVTKSDAAYVNTLPQACATLSEGATFTFPPDRVALCAGEMIEIVDVEAGPRIAATCALGRFVRGE